MKKLNFGKSALSAILAMLTLMIIGMGCGAEKPSAPPTEAEAQTLVKNTMSEFADAVNKGDFAAFKANTAKEFQSQYTDEQMKTAFKSFIDQKEDAVPLLRDAAKQNAKFTTPPTVGDEQGYSVLPLEGTFDTDPAPLKFKNKYVYQDGKWKLLVIDVRL